MVLREVKGLNGRPGGKVPSFKLSELRAAIPAHCFERNTLKSMRYLAVDVAFVLFMVYLVHKVWNPSVLPAPFSWVGWLVYAAIQGSVMTGIWVLAHECGHQAFSPSQAVNDIVGFIFHTMLCVPYFSWKISHSKHHARTGHMGEDEVFVPREAEDADPSDHPLLHTAPMRLLQIVVMLVFGWPAYLVANVTAHKTPDFVMHFNPYCSLFSAKEHMLVFASDAGLIAWAYFLYVCAQTTSFQWVMWVYGIPMIVTNACLVTITALQHTHKDVPHYDHATWTWLRGALTTIDRNFGPWNVIFHHIGDTHIAHHLFSTMPFYHAQEATECLKPVLGEFYLYDPTPIYMALWRNTHDCFAVEQSKDGIRWWSKSKTLAPKKSK